jgi:hypothetical protein
MILFTFNTKMKSGYKRFKNKLHAKGERETIVKTNVQSLKSNAHSNIAKKKFDESRSEIPQKDEFKATSPVSKKPTDPLEVALKNLQVRHP